jgi:hypothetical protein
MNARYVIVDEWLTVETGRCTCAGGTVESSYAHESHCGLAIVEKLDVLADVLVPKSRAKLAEARIAKVEALCDEARLCSYKEDCQIHRYVSVADIRAALAAPEDGQR